MFLNRLKNLLSRSSNPAQKTRARRNVRSAEGIADIELLEPRKLMTAVGGAAQLSHLTVTLESNPVEATSHQSPVATVGSGSVASPADWYSQHFSDAGVANLVRQDYSQHHSITRSDVLGIFSEVERNGIVSAAEFQSLQSMVNQYQSLHMSLNVANEAFKVVDGNVANKYAVGYQGNLHANSSGKALAALSNEWFEGVEYIGGPQLTSFSQVHGTLFGAGGPKYTDVCQGTIGDCTLLSSMAEVAVRAPQDIANMFVNNGDGTWSVRFFHNGQQDWVTVAAALPNGGTIYDHPVNGVLWAALLEKAIVEVNEEGWLGSLQPGLNSYAAISMGNHSTADAYLSAITGLRSTYYSINPMNVAQAWEQGEFVILLSGNRDLKPYVVEQHAYAMIGLNPNSSYPFTLFNPWGSKANLGGAYEFVNVSASYLNSAFNEFAMAGTADQSIEDNSDF